jgi:hypothetical protein
MNLINGSADLKFKLVKEIDGLEQGEDVEEEVRGGLIFEQYWLLITNNPKGVYRVDDGWNSTYTNSITEAIELLNKFIEYNY